MCRFRVITLSLAAMAIASVTGAQQSDKQAPKIFTLSGEMLRGYQSVQRNLVEAAERLQADTGDQAVRSARGSRRADAVRHLLAVEG
jgi:hypothetical protein